MSRLGFYEDASQLIRGSGFLLLVLSGHCEPRGHSKTFFLIPGLLSCLCFSFLVGIWVSCAKSALWLLKNGESPSVSGQKMWQLWNYTGRSVQVICIICFPRKQQKHRKAFTGYANSQRQRVHWGHTCCCITSEANSVMITFIADKYIFSTWRVFNFISLLSK